MNTTVDSVLLIVGIPSLGFILIVGARFAWYVLSGRYWLDRRTGLFNRG